jgi:predicted dehydrogenase
VPTITRVGIIGAGRTSAGHIRALRGLSNIEITGVLDINASAARAIADRFGIHQYSDAERFYRDAQPESVHILTPPHTHEILADEAIGRGVHVLTEKPPALTVAGCEALQRKAAAASLTIGVNENFAFDPRVRSARNEIARGTLGHLVHISAFFGFNAAAVEANLSNWSWAKELPGGILEDLLPHPLTVASTLASEELLLVHRHVVRSGRLPFLLDDEMRLLLTGRSSLTVQLTLSRSTRPASFIIMIYGTRATLRIDLRNMLILLSHGATKSGLFAVGLRATAPAIQALLQTAKNAIGTILFRSTRAGDPSYLIRSHYEALQQGREVPTPIARAKNTVQIAREIWPHGSKPPLAAALDPAHAHIGGSVHAAQVDQTPGPSGAFAPRKSTARNCTRG